MAEEEDPSYKRRVGITLAVLALVGGWISVLATNAGTNESRTTREATRLASEAQTARIVVQGVDAALRQINAEVTLFDSRDTFLVSDEAAAEVGVTLDPALNAERLAEGRALVEDALGNGEDVATAARTTADRLTLEQSATVEERVTWNARASQYETVLTTLAVAIFLIGFTLVVGRNLRPPFAAPGLILAVFCVGWSGQIYLKPIPDIDRGSIDSTADGQAALDGGRPGDAIASFEEAIGLDDGYGPAHRGLGLALMVEGNPDILNTLAFTDASPELVDAALAEFDEARSLDDEDLQAASLAGITAIVGTDWPLAAERLEEGMTGTNRTPGLQLARSAVAIAEGDAEAAQEWLERFAAQADDLVGSDTDRELAAQYLTLLEWVSDQEPQQAALADRFRTQGVALISESRSGDPVDLDAPPPSGIDFEILEARFEDGRTTVDLAKSGIPEGAQVIIIGYERPAPDASFVQPETLFYVGPDTEEGPVTLSTPRACHPVGYRFDLYVDGRFVATDTAPGTEPTC